MYKARKILFLVFFISFCAFSQKETEAFKNGEFLKFRINYGLINAGFASLEIKNSLKDNKTMYHVIGKGWSTGMVNFFFPVNDDYQTYINQTTLKPYHFIRKINEGGYTKDKEILFDFQKHQAKVINHKHNSEKNYFIQNDVQDMLSSLYYLRSLNLENLKPNEIITINMFFDNTMNKIRLKFKKRDVINTKFGKIKALVFQPMVQIGRVFKDEKSITLWISDDKNKIPLRIKASIIVGSLKADLIMYKGLANGLPIIFN